MTRSHQRSTGLAGGVDREPLDTPDWEPLHRLVFILKGLEPPGANQAPVGHG